ncbi:hypothetical protein GCM10020000_52420 [Streptomyces olivoverticillatus]
MTTQPQLPRSVAPPRLQRAAMLDRVEERLRGFLDEEHRLRRTSDARGAGLIESLAELVAAAAATGRAPSSSSPDTSRRAATRTGARPSTRPPPSSSSTPAP